MTREEVRATLEPVFDKLFAECLQEYEYEKDVTKKKRMVRLTLRAVFEKKFDDAKLPVLVEKAKIPKEAVTAMNSVLLELLHDRVSKIE